MKRSLVKIGAAMIGLMMLVGGVAFPRMAYAADPICSDSSASEDLKKAAGCGVTETNAKNITGTVIKVLMYIAGILAVIMVIYAGFLYVTSAGDSGKVQKAKTALIYAVVGIVVAVLAYAIVAFVIKQV